MGNIMKKALSFVQTNLTMIIVFLVGIIAMTMYSQNKSSVVDGMAGGRNDEDVEEADPSVEPAKPLGTNEDYAKVSGITTTTPGLSSNCATVSTLEPSDLLPSDKNNEWAKLNPSGQGELADVNLLQAGYHSGINTVAGQAMRNSNLQLRSDPPVNKENVGPWNNSTIEADSSRLNFEIASSM
jgi:hypothetical protein|tara:strand:+ start:507 stop:1055 length:549 start_codon:yes stop_codon:yes gene_type:complete